MKSSSQLFNPARFQKPSTKATHEGVEVVEYFQKHGVDIEQKGRFGFAFHLGKIKQCGIKMYHAEKIVTIMQGRAAYVRQQSGEEMHRGKWLTNRYKEIREVGVTGFISKNT